MGMSEDVFVPYGELPKPHTGSFLTAKEIESFKDAFKDIVRVVRCKDCEHCYFASNRVQNERSYACGKHGIDVTPNWFCADGEREVK